MLKPDVPDVVNWLLSGLAMLNLHGPEAARRGYSMTPMEGMTDGGQKERNAIELRFATGERFVIFVAAMPPLEGGADGPQE